jgi:hypothetical protein
MNITGGKFNGRKITTVKSNDVRPTSSKVRASIFNMLNSIGGDLRGLFFWICLQEAQLWALRHYQEGLIKVFW